MFNSTTNVIAALILALVLTIYIGSRVDRLAHEWSDGLHNVVSASIGQKGD